MHSFAIDVKGGESKRILPSIIKGEIVGHRLSLMSIRQYSRSRQNGVKRSRRSQRGTTEQSHQSKWRASVTEVLLSQKFCYHGEVVLHDLLLSLKLWCVEE